MAPHSLSLIQTEHRAALVLLFHAAAESPVTANSPWPAENNPRQLRFGEIQGRVERRAGRLRRLREDERSAGELALHALSTATIVHSCLFASIPFLISSD